MSIQTGTEALERLALHYQDIADAAALLKEAGGAEQLMKEAKAAANAATEQAEAAKKALAAVEEKQAEVQAAIAEAEAQTLKRCEEHIQVARDTSLAIEESAKASADEMRATAAQECRELRAQAEAVMDEANRTQTEVTQKVAALVDEIRTRQQELEDLNTKIAQARAEVKRIMGGE